MNKNYKWLVVAMLWFVCFFNYADRQAIFSVFPLLKAEMGFTDIQLGVIGGAFMIVYAIAGPLAGLAGDRFTRKNLILGGLVFWSIVTVFTSICTTYWHLVLVRALEGLGESFYFPAAIALVSDYHGKDTRSRALSFHQSSVYAGTIAGGSVSGYMGEHYGWRSSFILFGALGVVLALILWGLLKEPVRGASEEGEETSTQPATIKETLAGIFQSPLVPVLIAVFVGANFVASIFLTWMPSFLFNKFKMSLSLAGFQSTAYLQVASVIGVLLGGYFGDRIAKRYPGGRPYTQVIGLIGGTPFLFLTGWTLDVPVLVMAMTFFGLFKGFYDSNNWASLYDVVKPRWRSSALGLMNSIGWLGGSLAPVSIAWASERFGMSAAISSSSVIYFCVGLLLLYSTRKYYRSVRA